MRAYAFFQAIMVRCLYLTDGSLLMINFVNIVYCHESWTNINII